VDTADSGRMRTIGVPATVGLRRHEPGDALFDARVAGGVDAVEEG